MKWLAIVFLCLCVAALERRVDRLESEARRTAIDVTCKTLVEARLVGSCGERDPKAWEGEL